jgi:peptidoglycan/LPS O-acetylase OafA/YrhL
MTTGMLQFVLLAYSLAVSLSFHQLLRRAGLRRWWLLLLACLPVTNVIALWIFAYVRWPSDRSGNDNDKRRKANEVQALVDAIGHTGAVNALTRRGGNTDESAPPLTSKDSLPRR